MCCKSVQTVYVTKLRERGLPLAEVINIYENGERSFEICRGTIGKAILIKFININNIGSKVLKKNQINYCLIKL